MSEKTAEGRETTGSATLAKEGGAWRSKMRVGLSLCQRRRAAADVASRVSKTFPHGGDRRFLGSHPARLLGYFPSASA